RIAYIHKLIQKLVFSRVSLAANFRSSLAPCYSAMVARSRHKNWRRFLAKNQLLNQFVYNPFLFKEDFYMELKGKALYNLLKINALDNPKVASAPWQIEDLSTLSTSKLFERLNRLNLSLDENSFLLYANEAESPEELTDYVWVNESDE